MVVQVQALAAAPARGDGAIAGHGRRAMAEMHRTLSLLRAADDPRVDPSPGSTGSTTWSTAPAPRACRSR